MIYYIFPMCHSLSFKSCNFEPNVFRRAESVDLQRQATMTVRCGEHFYLGALDVIGKRRFDKTTGEPVSNDPVDRLMETFSSRQTRSASSDLLPAVVLLVVLKPSRYRTPLLKRRYSFARTVERGELRCTICD